MQYRGLPGCCSVPQQALALFREIGHQHGQSEALTDLAVVQRLTGDYPAAAASLRLAQALTVTSATATSRPGLAPNSGCCSGSPATTRRPKPASSRHSNSGATSATTPARLVSLNELGLVQQLTGDYPAAETSHLQALTLYRDLGQRQEQAEVLNSLGELSSRAQPASRPAVTTTRRWPSPATSARR